MMQLRKVLSTDIIEIKKIQRINLLMWLLVMIMQRKRISIQRRIEMRPIFRARIKETNEVFPVTTIWENSVCLDLTMSNYEYDYKVFNKREVDLLQYTGIKDKNLNGIFESDICKRKVLAFGEIRTFIGQVKMFEGRLWIDNERAAVPLWDETHELEIIGNIYKNPELLKN